MTEDDTPSGSERRRRVVLPGGVLTHKVIEAEQALAYAIPARTEIPIPQIKGRVPQRLELAEVRHEVNDEELEFRDAGPEINLRQGDERGSVALACLVLETIRQHGGSEVPRKALASVLERTMISLTQREVMEVEIEAYEIFRWLGVAINPFFDHEVDPRPPDARDDKSDILTHIEHAIREGYDLEISYYTGGRGEWSRRRITPSVIRAETYLVAYCYRRKDDRVFRLSRIGQVRRAR